MPGRRTARGWRRPRHRRVDLWRGPLRQPCRKICCPDRLVTRRHAKPPSPEPIRRKHLGVPAQDTPTRSARKSSHVWRPTARSGARLAPARKARAAWPGIRTRRTIRCFAPGPQVRTNQVGHGVDLWPSHVGNQSRRWAEGEVDELGRHLRGVDGLEPESGRSRHHGKAGHGPDRLQHQVMELARSVVHGSPESATAGSAASLDPK